MMIKDLEMSKDLDRDALSAVRGGGNSISQGGIDAPVANIGAGFSFASPTTIVSAPVNTPTAILNDNDLVSGYRHQDCERVGFAGYGGRAVSRYTVVNAGSETGVFGPPFSCMPATTSWPPGLSLLLPRLNTHLVPWVAGGKARVPLVESPPKVYLVATGRKHLIESKPSTLTSSYPTRQRSRDYRFGGMLRPKSYTTVIRMALRLHRHPFLYPGNCSDKT